MPRLPPIVYSGARGGDPVILPRPRFVSVQVRLAESMASAGEVWQAYAAALEDRRLPLDREAVHRVLRACHRVLMTSRNAPPQASIDYDLYRRVFPLVDELVEDPALERERGHYDIIRFAEVRAALEEATKEVLALPTSQP